MWLFTIGLLFLAGSIGKIESENFKLKKLLKDKGFDFKDYL